MHEVDRRIGGLSDRVNTLKDLVRKLKSDVRVGHVVALFNLNAQNEPSSFLGLKKQLGYLKRKLTLFRTTKRQ